MEKMKLNINYILYQNENIHKSMTNTSQTLNEVKGSFSYFESLQLVFMLSTKEKTAPGNTLNEFLSDAQEY